MNQKSESKHYDALAEMIRQAKESSIIPNFASNVKTEWLMKERNKPGPKPKPASKLKTIRISTMCSTEEIELLGGTVQARDIAANAIAGRIDLAKIQKQNS